MEKEEVKKEGLRSMNEFELAWNEFFKDKPEPKNDDEERKEQEEFHHWYNYIRKQSDTGKTPAEMYKEDYGEEPKNIFDEKKPSRFMNFEWDKDYDEELMHLIYDLQKYDNKEGYKMEYEEAKRRLAPIIEKLIAKGEKALELVYELLENEETLSCLFALEILKEIKSEKSIPYLVDFIVKNQEGDYSEGCDDAMNALVSIGKPAIPILLEKIKENFEDKKEYSFLTGALASIKDEKVCNFMVETVKDYINDYKKYDGWLDIHMFVADFDKQENKDILPLLKQLVAMDNLSKNEKLEIADTIKVIEDPKKFEEETKKELNKFKDSFEGFDKFLGKSKITNEDKEEFLERANEADEEFEANFLCNKCKERQNIRTGLIWCVDNRKENEYFFEYEIMCKKCHSHDIELTQEGKMEILGKQMRVLINKDKGVMPVGKKIMIEDKELPYNKAYEYILKRLEEEPENGEIYLRAANTAGKFNKYNEAIEFYEKSMQLNNKLIASYINLVEIYLNRYESYGIIDAGQKAIEYFVKLTELFNSHEYNMATIRNKAFIEDFLIEGAKRLGLNVRMKKVGRNEPCPCGSGKKYKKCCLDKDDKRQ